MNIYEVPVNRFLEMSNYSRSATAAKKARYWIRRNTLFLVMCAAFTLWFAVFGTISLHDHGPANFNTIADFAFLLVFGFFTGMYIHTLQTWRKIRSEAHFVTDRMSFEVSWITFLLSGPIGDPLMSQDRR